MKFTELSLGCWLSGHKNVYMYQVSSSCLCQLHTLTCPLYNVLLEVVCCFPRNELFINMTLFIGSQSYISPPSFMFVSAAVSEIHELNQKKKKKKKEKEKKSEIGYFPFLGISIF